MRPGIITLSSLLILFSASVILTVFKPVGLHRPIKFQPRPQVSCMLDMFICPDGTYLSRVPPRCEFPACPDPVSPQRFGVVSCLDDVRSCPDGSFVTRQAPSCEFTLCPTK